MIVSALTRALRLTRLLTVTWALQLKMLAVSPFDALMQVVWPLFFATSALLVYRIRSDPQVMIYAGMGAAIMGIWSVIATAASNSLQRERWLGTLELLVAAPTPFPLTLMPITTAMATMGLWSVAATLLWDRFIFGIHLQLASPVLFAISVVVAVGAMAMLGFLLSVVVVRYRTAWALGNMLEYPGWLLCGFLVPVTILPGWVRPVSYLLAPTWGMSAIRQTVEHGTPWPDIAACALLGAGYGLLASLLSDTVLRSARRRATLSLS